MKKFKWLIVSLIGLTFLLPVGFFFFQGSRERVKKISWAHYQTTYESHDNNQATWEEKKYQEQIKAAEQIRRDHEQIRKENEQWKEKHKNHYETCHKCGKKFCLGTEGSVKKSWTYGSGEENKKTEYFCGECNKK